MGIADRLVVTSVPDLYLASTSPRRKALLAAACITFALCEPGPEYLPGSGDEHTSVLGDPVALAAERARRKGLGAEPPDPGRPVLAVDTVVDLDGVEFGKPSDRVHTAHCLSLPSRGLYVEEVSHATVRCGPVVEASLQHYLDSGQWRGKAGSYGMQDDAQDFFALVDGAFDTVVGLHVPAVHRLLAALRSRS